MREPEASADAGSRTGAAGTAPAVEDVTPGTAPAGSLGLAAGRWASWRRGPLELRSLALSGILALGIFHTLHVARSLLLPIVLAGLASLALRPVARALAKRGLPLWAAAATILIVLVVGTGVALTTLYSPAVRWIDQAPTTFREVERKLRPIRAPVERIAQATAGVEEATTIEVEATEKVVVSMEQKSLFSNLVLQTQGILATLVATLGLLFFLLASGDAFIRKVAALSPGPQGEEGAAELIEGIEGEVSKNLLTISTINVALGCVVGVAMAVLGMPNPALWGAMAGLLNFVPFLGALLGTLVVAVVALISFDDTASPLLVPAVFAGLTGIEGLLITPWLLGRRLVLSPVAVFASVLLWSWLWGVPGALIAVPVLVVAKTVCDRVESLRFVALLLGR